MAKNKSSFQMLPDDVLNNATDNVNVTHVTNFADSADVTFDTLNKSVTEESNNQSVQPVTPEIPAPVIEQASNVTQPINVTYTQQVTQPNDVTPVPQVQYPVQEAVPAKTRVYVNIKTDNYNWVKRETGATGETLQNFFDSLIEEYRATHKPHFTD